MQSIADFASWPVLGLELRFSILNELTNAIVGPWLFLRTGARDLLLLDREKMHDHMSKLTCDHAFFYTYGESGGDSKGICDFNLFLGFFS